MIFVDKLTSFQSVQTASKRYDRSYEALERLLPVWIVPEHVPMPLPIRWWYLRSLQLRHYILCVCVCFKYNTKKEWKKKTITKKISGLDYYYYVYIYAKLNQTVEYRIFWMVSMSVWMNWAFEWNMFFYCLNYLQYATSIATESLRHQIIRYTNNMSFK